MITKPFPVLVNCQFGFWVAAPVLEHSLLLNTLKFCKQYEKGHLYILIYLSVLARLKISNSDFEKSTIYLSSDTESINF